MTVGAHRHVVVGLDGSPTSQLALNWAIEEARLRHRPLRLVHVLQDPYGGTMLAPVSVSHRGELRSWAEQLLANRREYAASQLPEQIVSTRLLEGDAAGELIGESGQAALMVLGQRGLGGFAGLVVGSVSMHVTAHAGCPVLVVPPKTSGQAETDGRIVVGADGSPNSLPAIGFAFEEAAWRSAPLVVVHGWRRPGPPQYRLPAQWPREIEAARDEERRLLAESVAGWCGKYPEVRVERRLVSGSPAAALLSQLPGAALAVVGCRGRGGFEGLLLGSTSQAVLHHAPCPVAVVRYPEGTSS